MLTDPFFPNGYVVDFPALFRLSGCEHPGHPRPVEMGTGTWPGTRQAPMQGLELQLHPGLVLAGSLTERLPHIQISVL